ncbi:hypothetical protein JCM21900_006394 [Sporobolomyces salmonicolor]
MPRGSKCQRTSSSTNDDAFPSTPTTTPSKLRISTGNYQADLNALLVAITKCRGQKNGFPFFEPPRFCEPPECDKDEVPFVIYECQMPHCDYSAKRLVTAAPAAQLHSHGFWCNSKEKCQQKLTDIPAFAGFGRLDPPEVLQAFAVWCACHGRPFSITDDSKRSVGGVYLALDAWTSPNGVEVLGVLAFFKTKAGKGELKDHVVPVAFKPLVDRHSGGYLAEVVRDICEVYGIQEKVSWTSSA